MKPAKAYDIMQNPDDYSAADVKKAKKVLKEYSEVTERDRTPPRSAGVTVSITLPTPPPKGRKTKTNKKAEMMMGGMANGKKHMYSAGGSVSDNPGLKALRASGPKGMEAYKKITGRNA